MTAYRREYVYFYEVLRSCDDGRLTHEFLKLRTRSPDIEHTGKADRPHGSDLTGHALSKIIKHCFDYHKTITLHCII